MNNDDLFLLVLIMGILSLAAGFGFGALLYFLFVIL